MVHFFRAEPGHFCRVSKPTASRSQDAASRRLAHSVIAKTSLQQTGYGDLA